MINTILIIIFMLYSIFASYLSLNFNRNVNKFSQNESFAFKFLCLYGEIFIVSFPFSCITYLVLKLFF
jgi:hypothetical protein